MRRALSLPGVVLLSLLLAASALAVTWQEPVALSEADPGNASAPGLVTLGASTAIAAYSEYRVVDDTYMQRVLVRRSTDSGDSWSGPTELSPEQPSGFASSSPSIAGRGSHVDVVWVRDGQIRYARSTDGGASFAPSVGLSPSGGSVKTAAVARGANGVVAVIYDRQKPDDIWSVRVRIRVSRDNGASFGKAKTLATGGGSAVAVGNGVIYAAYHSGGLHLRRSRDGGLSWSTARSLGRKAVDWAGLSIAAAGSTAYIAYSTGHVRYRRTTDRGTSWSPAMDLTSRTGDAWSPVISLKGGVVRALIARCTNCDGSGDGRLNVFYKRSSDGVRWTKPLQVSTAEAVPLGIGHAGRVIALYQDLEVGGVYVRTAIP